MRNALLLSLATLAMSPMALAGESADATLNTVERAPNHRASNGARASSGRSSNNANVRRSSSSRSSSSRTTVVRRSSSSRPVATRTVVRRPTPPRAPPVKVVHTRPAPRVVVHRRPAPQVVVRTPPRRIVVSRPSPAHGVFVYGPRPSTHVNYRSNTPQEVRPADLPKRHVDRDDTFAIGLRSSVLVGGYKGGDAYGDFGLGVNLRYRPVEAFAAELAISHHNEEWNPETQRAQTTGQASGMLFLSPWSRLSPYALAGLTVNGRHIDDDVALAGGDATVKGEGILWGPHAGVGLEIALGENLALDVDARYTAYVNQSSEDISHPGALTVGGGIVAHF